MMANPSEVADNIYRFEVPLTGMPHPTVAYIINEPNGVLIDPGPAAAIPYLEEALKHLQMKELSYIIPTHIHVDHAGGTGAMARLHPKAKVVVHPRGAKHLISPSRLIESTKLVWGDDFPAHLGPIDAVPESQLHVPKDGEIIPLGKRELQIIYATGHSPNHIVILDRKVSGLFCGEALGLPGHQMPPVAPYSYDQDIYLDTIEKLRKLDAKMLFYSHGGLEGDPDRLISRAAENARIYGKMILEAAGRSDAPEDIMHAVGQHFSQRFGIQLSKADLEITVAGYVIYFKTKGLLT